MMQLLQKIILIVLVLLLAPGFIGGTLFSQDIADNPTCPTVQTQYVRHYEAGAPLPADLVIQAPGSNASWSFAFSTTVSADCSPIPYSSVNINGDTRNVGSSNLIASFNSGGFLSSNNVTISSGGALNEGEYNLTLRVVTGGNTYVKNFLFIVRKPIDILFTLDRSGSMECDVDEDVPSEWPGCTSFNNAAGDGRRWDMLAGAMEAFVSSTDDLHTLPTDRMSVVYFDGTTSTASSLLGGASFVPINTFRGFGGGATPIKQELDNMADGINLGRNGTSIGAGINEAISNKFGGTESADRRQIIILFTDGEQNTGFQLLASGPHTGRRVVESSAAGAPEILNLDAPSIDGIQLITVGISYMGVMPALLQNAASGPNSFYSVMPGAEAAFGADLAGHVFNEVFSMASPRFIDSKTVNLSRNSGNAAADFTVNKNVNRTIFQAFFSTPIANRLKARVFKDGIDVSRKGELRISPYSISFLFPLYEIPELSSEGKWTMEILPPSRGIPPGTEISIFGTADDHSIRFEAGTVEDDLIVGRSFRPDLDLFENGSPVDGATVTATIIKPVGDLGDVLGRTQTSQLPQATKESGSCADIKFAHLRQTNPEALAGVLTQQRKTIPLNSAGQGRYEGTFSDVDVTGVYKIRYDIEYQSPRLGTVRRMVERTRYVDFPPPALNLTVAGKDNQREVSHGNVQPVVVARPSYTVNGVTRLIGPGYATAFGVTKSSVRLASFDNCDGSYQLRVSGTPTQKFELYLKEEIVFEGTVAEFNSGETGPGTFTPGTGTSPVKGYLSVSGGITLPQGDFGLQNEQGIYGQVGLGRRFGGLLGLELVGGYYSFNPGFHIIGGTGYLNLYFGKRTGSHLLIGAGPGYYFPEAGDARVGGSAKAALERQFGRLSLGIEGGYFRLTDPELDFATLGIRATLGL